MSSESALLLLQPGDMCIAEERNAVRRKLVDLIHRVSEALGSLMRQAVDQIDVYAIETQLAGGTDQIAGHFEGLDAMDGFLHVRMEVLDTHAEAVEAKPAQRFQVRAGGYAWVDFDAHLRVRREGEAFLRGSEQVLDLLRRQIRGS